MVAAAPERRVTLARTLLPPHIYHRTRTLKHQYTDYRETQWGEGGATNYIGLSGFVQYIVILVLLSSDILLNILSTLKVNLFKMLIMII